MSQMRVSGVTTLAMNAETAPSYGYSVALHRVATEIVVLREWKRMCKMNK